MLQCLRVRLSPAKSKNQSFKIGHICIFVVAQPAVGTTSPEHSSAAHDVVTFTCSAHRVTASTSSRSRSYVHPKLPPPKASASDMGGHHQRPGVPAQHETITASKLGLPRFGVTCCGGQGSPWSAATAASRASHCCSTPSPTTGTRNRLMMSARHRFELKTKGTSRLSGAIG